MTLEQRTRICQPLSLPRLHTVDFRWLDPSPHLVYGEPPQALSSQATVAYAGSLFTSHAHVRRNSTSSLLTSNIQWTSTATHSVLPQAPSQATYSGSPQAPSQAMYSGPLQALFTSHVQWTSAGSLFTSHIQAPAPSSQATYSGPPQAPAPSSQATYGGPPQAPAPSSQATYSGPPQAPTSQWTSTGTQSTPFCQV